MRPDVYRWFLFLWPALVCGQLACVQSDDGPEPTTKVGALEATTPRTEFADTQEVMLRFELPSMEDRALRRTYPAGRVRVTGTAGRLELTSTAITHEIVEEDGTLLVLVPRSFDAIDIIVEVDLFDEDGQVTTVAREIPSGYARALPQMAIRPRERHRQRQSAENLDKVYDTDGGVK